LPLRPAVEKRGARCLIKRDREASSAISIRTVAPPLALWAAERKVGAAALPPAEGGATSPAEGGAFPSSSAHRVVVTLQSFMVAASLHHILGPPASHSAAVVTVESTMACVAGSSWLRTARVQSAFSWPCCPAQGSSPLPLPLPLAVAPPLGFAAIWRICQGDVCR
jgi:hypothetical protein